ncbi:MAG: ParA family protein [Saprospiraceae bacterium]|nr:ParA family protein [Saprospiraceae bacterium]
MAKDPKIISVANSKGGVGKSVVTLLLATSLAQEKGKKVLVIDCDSQASIQEMYEQEKELYPDKTPLIEVEALSPRRVQTFMKRFGADYDVIFIDIPRMTDQKQDSATVMLLYNCDGLLIPVIGSEVDILSTQEFMAIAKEAEAFKQEMKEHLTVYGFINRRNQRKSNELAEQLLRKQGLKMFNHSIPDLKIFTTPSIFKSPLSVAEGQRRFKDFFDEFCRKFKV